MSSATCRRSGRSLAFRACVLAACAFAAVGVPSAALAQANAPQEDARPTPPTPGKKEDPSVFLYYGLLVILLALIFGANAVPAKRGHQD